MAEPAERPEHPGSQEEEQDDGEAGDDGDDDPGPGPDVVQPVCRVEPVSPGLETEEAVSSLLQPTDHHLLLSGGAGECPEGEISPGCALIGPCYYITALSLVEMLPQ